MLSTGYSRFLFINRMSQIIQHTNRSTIDCDVEFILPLSFMHEWMNLTTKQHWMAQVKCEKIIDKLGTDCMSASLETDSCIISDLEGEQRPYLSVKISGVSLQCNDRKLQLTILDAKSTDINTENKNKAKSGDCRISEDDRLESVVSIDSGFQAPHSHQKAVCSEVLTLKAQECADQEFDRISSDLSESHRENSPSGSVEVNTAERLQKSTEACHDGSKTPGGGPQSSHHPYRLRGKKLSFSRFGADDFDLKGAGDEDYQSCVRISSVKKLLQTRRRTEKNHDSIPKGKEESRRKTEKEHISGCNMENDTKTQDGQHLVKSAILDIPSFASPSSSPISSSPSSSSPLSSSTKRGRRSSTQHKSVVDSHQPSKKKRLKIIVEGLPKFSRRVTNKARKASCKYCQRKLCDFTGVAMHVKKFHRSEVGVEDYLEELKALSGTRCAVCHQELDDRFQLQLHEDKVHFKAGDMRCDQCGKSFTNVILLKQHVRSVHLVQGQGHACSLCPARFKWAATLKTHMADIHKGTRDLACLVCGKKFHRRAQLNRHSIIHGPDHAKLTCDLCERKFWYPSNLQRHMVIVHGPRSEGWHCAYCGKGFPRRESVNNHVEKVHYSLFPHSCSVCGTGFTRHALLEKHMASKHGESDSVQARSARPVRFKYNRSEEDKVVCGLCGDHFCYKAQLVQHVFRAHRDTFPFHCDVCQQVFMERSFLVFHRQRAHQIQPGPEDADFDVGESTAVQERGTKCQKKRNLGSQNMTEKKTDCYTETDTPLAHTEHTHAVSDSVGGSDSHVQYIIQIPDSLSTVPADTLTQYINHLLTAEHPTQENNETINTPTLPDLSPPISSLQLQGSVVQPEGHDVGIVVPNTDC